MEKTLVLVKPDGVENCHAGAILARLEARGVKLAAVRMLKISRETAERHYAVHKERKSVEFFLLNFCLFLEE